MSIKTITLPNKLLSIGKTKLNKKCFNNIKNRQEFIKPDGGLWTSPYMPKEKFYSAWHEWCIKENYEIGLSDNAIIIELKDDTLFYCIDSQQDLIDFIEIVGRQESIIEKAIGICNQVVPDWENASKIFDVIYLTEKGQIETRIPYDNFKYNLYGWDCESCLIMNYDCINTWKYVELNIK